MVESQIVILVVAGSSPVGHPTFLSSHPQDAQTVLVPYESYDVRLPFRIESPYSPLTHGGARSPHQLYLQKSAAPS